MQSGYKPLKQNHKDYDYHQSYGSTPPPFFPESFDVDAKIWMPNQNLPQTFAVTGQDTLTVPALPFGCTDYVQTDLCMDEDLKLLNPLDLENITHANARQGADIRTALEAARQAFGRTAYFNVRRAKPLDWYDSLRLVMLSTPEEKRAISIGIPWYYSFHNPTNGVLPSFIPGEGFTWHNAVIVGWDARGLKIKSLQGSEYGDNGYCYMPRALANTLFDIPGSCAFTISKIAPKQIITVDMSFVQYFVSLVLNLFKQNTPQIAPTLPPEQAPEAPTSPADAPKYDWSTPAEARHSLRLICDEEGLTVAQKNDMSQIVHCESGYKNIIHQNIASKTLSDGSVHSYVSSTDWGICMINDYWHIGPGKEFPSTDYVMNNPDACVRWMARMIKAGKRNLWVCASTGLCKNYSA